MSFRPVDSFTNQGDPTISSEEEQFVPGKPVLQQPQEQQKEKPKETKESVFPLQAVRRFRGKKISGVEITDDDLLASSVEARPELREKVNHLLENGFSSTQILDQALENQSFFSSTEATPFEDGLATALRSVGPAIFGLVGGGMELMDSAADFTMKQASKIPGLGALDPDKQKERLTKAFDETADFPGKQLLNPETKLKLPTMQDLKEGFDSLTENQYSPVDEADARVDEVIGDLAALVLPGSDKFKKAGKIPSIMKGVGQMVSKAVKGFIRPTVQVAGGQVAKEGVKAVGGGEGYQELAKLGTMFMLGLRSPGSVDKFASEQQAAVRAKIPDTNISAENMVSKLKEFKKDLLRGTGQDFAEKKKILERINKIFKRVKKGQINLKDVEEILKENNELIGDPSTLTGTEARLKNIQKIMAETFEEYSIIDPQLVSEFKEANQTLHAVRESRKVMDFIAKREGLHVKEGISSSTLALMQFREGRPLRSLFTLGAGAVTAPVRTLQLINATPSLRGFYLKALEAAAKNDTASYMRNLKALDSGLKKEDENFGD